LNNLKSKKLNNILNYPTPPQEADSNSGPHKVIAHEVVTER
jgi:hypothetical protein